MAFTRNEGVVVSGGTLTATNLATGRGAQVHVTQGGGSEAARQVQQQMEAVLAALKEHGREIPNHGEVTEAAEGLKEELAKEKPSRLTLKSMLGGIAEAVKSVSGVAMAVEGLKVAVTMLLG